MINIADYQFEGPYREASTNFNEIAAVYVILNASDEMIDVGETDQLKTRLTTHERKDCWERNCEGDIYVAVRQEKNEEERRRVEKRIRNFYDFPCGEE